MYKSKKPYHYGTGRRKSSVARVHLFPNGTGSITINGRDIDEYFGLDTLKMVVRQPLNTTDTNGKVDIVATVVGGGVSGQAGAIRHGVARALLQMNEEFRPALKSAGFLTRDPRMKERKKYGPPCAPVQQALIYLPHSESRHVCGGFPSYIREENKGCLNTVLTPTADRGGKPLGGRHPRLYCAEHPRRLPAGGGGRGPD